MDEIYLLEFYYSRIEDTLQEEELEDIEGF